MLIVYCYRNCSTCRKALAFLKEHDILFEERPIVPQPPSASELLRMADGVGDIKRLFNTSGGAYRSLNLKERLPLLTRGQTIDLLAGNGMLIKRPFALGDEVALVGFREEEWRQALL